MQWFIDNRPDFREWLQKFHYFLRDSFKVPFPTTAGPMMHLGDVAAEISRRLSRLFLRDADGRRPVFGGAAMFQPTPTGATCSCSTSASTATTAPASAPRTRRAGRA